ncbi:hypothetical protein ABEB36_011432 [Hypothenemus hampei]|uniref:Ensconsin n=1 Tax=Hypothenemus hampei TaxID=57062 RepID=A0ABD1EFQ8_HYPHA
MAENVRDIPDQGKISVSDHPLHFASYSLEQNGDKETRLRTFKERQNEERQKKLEEIKAQALAAQKFKEQKEQERRRRLEEMRLKDDVRRHQVEERKRAINEAERDRLESILRRNQEREARIEARKRNERSNIVFAFGSSTPRMLDPTDVTVSFWGYRRATSTQNITSTTSSGSSLTRRQSERDLENGSKKRATSAGGLERTGENLTSPTTPAGCASGYLGRRRTDLVPTIPSRDSSFHSSASRKSLNHSPASSRPSSSMSHQSTNSVASSVNVRQRVSNTPRRPRPVSIAVTGVTHDGAKNDPKPPLPKARKPLSKTNTFEKIDKKPAKLHVKSPAEETAPKIIAVDKKVENVHRPQEISNKEPSPPPPSIPPVNTAIKQAMKTSVEVEVPLEQPAVQEQNVIQNFIDAEKSASIEAAPIIQKLETVPQTIETGKQETNESSDMTASMSKPRITTEEEAKAAIAERRRLIREEAEKQAELERQRIEAEQKAELERQLKEEAQARQLAELQRQAEQERLQEAIREVQKREEEERLRKEEEQKQKLLKEEADKKAKEEAERQKAELQKKLENEEKEREMRRRRVEMIMSRTRGKNNSTPTQQNSQDKNENASENRQNLDENQLNEENKLNGTKSDNNTTTKNGKNVEVGIVDNIIPGESVKNTNANTVADTINANSAWQASSQQFLDVS